MRDERLRVGVIGVGSMGRNHLRVLSSLPEYELTGCFDVDADLSMEQAARHGIKSYASQDDLLADVEVAHIVTPSYLHRLGVLSAAEAGCHVLVEKPIALTIEDADAIIAACDKAGVRLCVGHVERYNPAVMALQRVLMGKRIIALAFDRLSPRVDRGTDASVVEDLMIHDIDILLSIVGAPIYDIAAQGSVIYTGQLDHAQALISFANGVNASLTASRVTEAKVRTARITTEDSFICIDYIDRSVDVYQKSSIDLGSEYLGQYSLESTVERIVVQMSEPLANEFRHFAQCIRQGTDVLTNGESARQALSVCQAIDTKALPTDTER
jgi:predicted dehydrogenase